MRVVLIAAGLNHFSKDRTLLFICRPVFESFNDHHRWSSMRNYLDIHFNSCHNQDSLRCNSKCGVGLYTALLMRLLKVSTIRSSSLLKSHTSDLRIVHWLSKHLFHQLIVPSLFRQRHWILSNWSKHRGSSSISPVILSKIDLLPGSTSSRGSVDRSKDHPWSAMPWPSDAEQSAATRLDLEKDNCCSGQSIHQ